MNAYRLLFSWLCITLAVIAGSCGGGSTEEPPSNKAPVASDGTLSTQRDTPADGMLEASDADGDTLTYAIVANGSLGSAVISDASTGAYTYTPNEGVTGEDTFTFEANDGAENSNTAIVTVTISGPSAAIVTTGGRGGRNGGSGGPGATVQILKRAGSGNIEILGSGAADASFTPASPTANLGANPLVITLNTDIDVVIAEPPEGTPYFVASDLSVYVSDGDGDVRNEPPVSGISVADGALLTLGLNVSGFDAYVSLANDFLNEGTVTSVDRDPSTRGGITLQVGSYLGDGRIRTNGTLDGQSGGTATISARFPIVNEGSIDASGADGISGPGGAGGSVRMDSQVAIDNTGEINASGGSSGGHDAGPGGAILLFGRRGIRNAGNLTSAGGAGLNGGDGREIVMQIQGPFAESGDVLNSGNLDASGGDGTELLGGNAGEVFVALYGSNLRTSGDINTRGGDTSSVDGIPGRGGPIRLQVNGGGAGPTGEVDIGDIEVSGNIDASGGDAPSDGSASGAPGGALLIGTNAEFSSANADLQQRIALRGYHRIDTSGGDGNQGGTAGPALFENVQSAGPFGDVPSGGILNEADLDVRGGDAAADGALVTARGGCGGQVRMMTQFDPSASASLNDVTVENSGNITGGSGDSFNAGGPLPCGTTFELVALDGVNNSGDIDNSGGHDLSDDGGATSKGDEGSPIIFRAQGPVTNSGDLKANGGNGAYTAGFAREIRLLGTEVVNTGSISCAGGDADPAIEGSNGGRGGFVELSGSQGLGSVDNSGAVSIEGGIGETPGEEGAFLEDGFCVAGNC